ncbi:hypothetical protein CLU79DRAFT_397327 [Phycomyces nitens]|nr:hypothetical protein CLU79DRAFT_397327 [Phycomyces nitens]
MRVPGYSCTLFLLSLAISAVVGQDASFDTLVDHYESIQVLNDTSNGFVVEYHNWYKVVRNLVTNENYAVVCCNQKATTLKGFTAILNEPLQTVGVSDAQSVLSFIELLGLSDVVRSANSYKAITSPCYTNLTATPNTATGTVDAIFATRPTSNQLTNTPYISFSADTNTLTPLQVH